MPVGRPPMSAALRPTRRTKTLSRRAGTAAQRPTDACSKSDRAAWTMPSGTHAHHLELTLIFKYLSPDLAKLALAATDQFSLGFALPMAFSDPYELFVTPDSELPSNALAFFSAFVGDIPEFPVSCFSKLPNSLSMWAHYCHQSGGVCVGFDENDLLTQFNVAYAADVKYRRTPAQLDSNAILMAVGTGKNRHTESVISQALTLAYFTKLSEWKYEREWRLVVNRDELRETECRFVAPLDYGAIRTIIVGAKTLPELTQLSEVRANEHNLQLLKCANGKRTRVLYFIGAGGETFVWKRRRFNISEACPGCAEPGDGDSCVWCDIRDGDKADAISNSSYMSFRRSGALPAIVSFAGIPPRGRAVGSPLSNR